jgi:predicted amidohydrolase
LICYDLRFPVWSRNDLDYDLLIYVANWPERRTFFWSQLLVARAIENQSYVIGVNRIGNDGNNVSHSGDSTCLDPLGSAVVKSEAGEEHIANFTLSKGTLNRVRGKFRFLNDKDDFQLTI